MKEIFVKDLRKDQEITTFFMAKNPAIKIGANGKQYLDITLADKTGEVSGKKWDVGDSEYNALAALYNKQIVKIKGLVVEWAGQLQIRVQRIRAAAESDEQQMRDFVKAAPEEPEEMYRYIHQAAESMRDQDLRGAVPQGARRQPRKAHVLPGRAENTTMPSWADCFITPNAC